MVEKGDFLPQAADDIKGFVSFRYVKDFCMFVSGLMRLRIKVKDIRLEKGNLLVVISVPECGLCCKLLYRGSTVNTENNKQKLPSVWLPFLMKRILSKSVVNLHAASLEQTLFIKDCFCFAWQARDVSSPQIQTLSQSPSDWHVVSPPISLFPGKPGRL